MALLENIQVFVRVVDLGSLSAAGRSLRLSPAVVSHRIQQLEQHLGVRLLNRNTRRLQLTEHGHKFHERCLEIVEALERAESSVATATDLPAGALRVTSPLGFGRRILAPLVARFHEQFPKVDVQFRLSDHLIDLLSEAVDVAIRMAVLKDSSLVVRKIADCPRVLCAAPSYLKRYGVPDQPSDLLNHRCLLLRYPGSQQYQWTLNTPEGPLKLPVSGPFDADDGDVLMDWALSGEGITLKPFFEVVQQLQRGHLEIVLPSFPPESASLVILYPHRHLLPAKVRVFADYMLEHIRPLVIADQRENAVRSKSAVGLRRAAAPEYQEHGV